MAVLAKRRAFHQKETIPIKKYCKDQVRSRNNRDLWGAVTAISRPLSKE